MNHGGLYIALYWDNDPPARLKEQVEYMAARAEEILLLGPRPDWLLPANIMRPRAPGSLAAWLGLWQDTPAHNILWHDAAFPCPQPGVFTALTAQCGQIRAMAAPGWHTCYFHRACYGIGHRLYKQGQRELTALLKTLKIPVLPV